MIKILLCMITAFIIALMYITIGFEATMLVIIALICFNNIRKENL